MFRNVSVVRLCNRLFSDRALFRYPITVRSSSVSTAHRLEDYAFYILIHLKQNELMSPIVSNASIGSCRLE